MKEEVKETEWIQNEKNHGENGKGSSRTTDVFLLHGDLWGGNWIPGKNGEPVLIDTAVVYAIMKWIWLSQNCLANSLLIFTRLMLTFCQLKKNIKDRKELYQLFYLLVHLNLFGETYGRPIDRILKKYLS